MPIHQVSFHHHYRLITGTSRTRKLKKTHSLKIVTSKTPKKKIAIHFIMVFKPMDHWNIQQQQQQQANKLTNKQTINHHS